MNIFKSSLPRTHAPTHTPTHKKTTKFSDKFGFIFNLWPKWLEKKKKKNKQTVSIHKPCV